ncbi:sugar phosphate isomerase/epimerase family protein [Listeria ilorinensis]|uniref:sugar phosphate isomerase/epimerase family protein n=1 Tax=Listeria ilorinensis TaxID=2867439 RepID=UPI001EF67978|nr:sugar phosphate isomerase/epimerase [Listeria ilorinensis]
MSWQEKIAVQLYSVRKAMEKDLDGTLKRISEMGIRYVQLDGMRGNQTEEVARLLKHYDLKVIGMHIKHDRFFDDVDGILYEACLFDCKTIYDKYIEEEDQTLSGYKKTKRALVDLQYKLSPLGFRVGLHNPEFDFADQVDGRYVMDYLTDPENGISLYAEPDTYWISVAGMDPVEYIKRYSGRAPIIHMKDFVPGFDRMDMANNLTEIGSGTVDFRSVIEWGEQNGVEYYCIEQDQSQMDMFDSLEKSIAALKEMF